MLSKKYFHFISLTFVTFVLFACGGNSSESPTQPEPTPDTTAPVIILVGDSTITHEAATAFTDPGATASDNVDGNITNNINVTGNVDISNLGTYTLTYNVNDTSGNNAAPLTRTVNVVDTTEPVVTLIGSPTITHEVGDDYIDAGANASDTLEGDITSGIVTSGSVNTLVLGDYTITYTSTDASNNTASVSRVVSVVDTTAPIITLLGDTTLTIERNNNYTEAGATATDNLDGDISASIVVTGSVNTNEIGTYDVTYNVSDANGNAALALTRTINVQDTTAPLVTSVSPANSENNVELGATVKVTFSEAIESNSVTTATFTLVDPDTNNVDSSVDLDVMGTTLTLTPDAPLLAGSTYTVNLATDIEDEAGNALASASIWSFTTIADTSSNLPEVINTPDSSFVGVPQFVVNDAGNGLAAWRQGNTILGNRYESGTGWQGVETISPVEDFPFETIELAVNSSGDIIAVWQNSDSRSNTTTLSARIYTTDSGWSDRLRIDNRQGLSRLPATSINDSGNALVVWEFTGNEDDLAGIYSRYYNASDSAWGEIEVVTLGIDDNFVSDPDVALNSLGNGVAVFTRSGDQIDAVLFDANVEEGFSTWSSLESIGLDTESVVADYPSVDINEAGKIFVGWVQATESNTAGDIYSNWYSQDLGWSTATAVETLDEGEARYPMVDINESDAVILWTEFDGATNSVYTSILNQLNELSTPALLEDGTGSAGNSNNGGARVKLDASGLVTAAWTQDILIEDIMTFRNRMVISQFNVIETPDPTNVTVLEQENDIAEVFEVALGVDAEGNIIVVSQRLFSNSLVIQAHVIN